ncbi:beta-lactamase class A [Chitinasiproducens palmae]|uniref:Beta-lactamase n=2 Tax=Chitinasiproducens palmae TaxID=1770053 RepID=A0A1H2PMW4_9BURK|nr:beta-lactamase class A [Chitinasiproducens palmae]
MLAVQRAAAVSANATPASVSSVAAEFARIEAATGGRLGVAVEDTASGRRLAYRGGERFPMCSTAKLLVCGAVLQRVDAGRDTLDRLVSFAPSALVTYSPATQPHAGTDGMTLEALCVAAMTLSDNTAANLLIASVGGPRGVTALARSLGDTVTRLDRNETTLNEAKPGDPRDTTSPIAMSSNVKALLYGTALSAPSRQRLLGWMNGNITGGAKLRAGVPGNWQVADKTGSGGHGTSNDVAVLIPPGTAPWPIAVYLTGAVGIDESARSAAIAAVARAVVRAWT